MNDNPGKVRTCLNCKSRNILEELEATCYDLPLKLKYKKSSSWFGGTILLYPLCVDLCKDCGTIDRFFVKETGKFGLGNLRGKM
jgi:hypothetical protein